TRGDPGNRPKVKEDVPQQEPAEARDLLASGVYSERSGGVMTKDGEILQIKIITPSNDPFPTINQMIQDQLAQVGITTTIETQEFASMITTRREGEQGIYVGNYGILDAAGAMKILFSCANVPPGNPTGNNLTFNCNEELDKTVEAAIVELDEQKRNGLLAEAQKILAEDNTSFTLYQ